MITQLLSRYSRESRLIAITLLSWLGIYICLRVQAGFIDPHQTLCMDGGAGCAKVLHNPKFVLMGMHPHEWGEIFFSGLIILGLAVTIFSSGLLSRILVIALKFAATIGLVAAIASLYAQYTLIHNICPLCFTLDCLLILIALSTIPARFCEVGEVKSPDPLLVTTASGSTAGSLSSSFKIGNIILTNLFGLAVLAIFIYAVKPGSGWEPPKVATVDGEDVNFFELQWIASDKTYKQDLEIYPIQKQALQERIDELVITHAAKKAGQSVNDYLAAKKVENDPTTDEGLKKKADLIAELSKSAQISNNLRKPTPQVLMMDPCHGIPVGDPTAPIRLVIFSDFECPYCRGAFPALEAFLKKHPKDISVLYCQFPLKELHPLATTAAMAGLCAQQQGKYAEYHDFLYKVADVKKGLTPEGLRDAAKQSGMDVATYDKCLASPETGKSIEDSIKESQDLNIPGIPAVYFNGKYMLKGPSAESLEKLYNEAMKAEAAKAQEATLPPSPAPAPLPAEVTNSMTSAVPANTIPTNSEIIQ